MIYHCSSCGKHQDIQTNAAWPHCSCGSSAWVGGPSFVVATDSTGHTSLIAEIEQLRAERDEARAEAERHAGHREQAYKELAEISAQNAEARAQLKAARSLLDGAPK